MCDVAESLVNKGIAQGKVEEHNANIEKLANNYLKTNAASTKEEAVKMAEAILGKLE